MHTASHPVPVRGESWACAWVRLHGYRVVARNWRMRGGEIDVVAVRGSRIAFIEVKARRRRQSASDVVHPRQLARVTRAAELYVARHPDVQAYHPRIDLLLVTGRGPWRRFAWLRDVGSDIPKVANVAT